MTADWSKRLLGDLCNVIAGQSPPGHSYNADGIGAPLYQGKKDFGAWSIGPPTAWTTQPTKVAVDGDILMSVRAPVGPINFSTNEICIGRGLAAIRTNGQLDKRFLFYQLLHLQPDISGKEGAVFASINKGDIEAIAIDYTPLPEQKRIVAILDEAFAAIDKAKANTERNIQNARAMFDRELELAFAHFDGQWHVKTLAEICSVFVDSAHRTPKYQEDGFPALRPRDIVNGVLNLNEVMRVSEAEFAIQTKRYRPQAGDIVYSRELSYGWAAELPPDTPMCLSQGMCVFRPAPDIGTSFLLAALNGPIGRRQAMTAAVGAAHPHINLSDIKAYRFPVPPLEDQVQIAGRLGKIRCYVEQLVEVGVRKTDKLLRLRGALLSQAFGGNLPTR